MLLSIYFMFSLLTSKSQTGIEPSFTCRAGVAILGNQIFLLSQAFPKDSCLPPPSTSFLTLLQGMIITVLGDRGGRRSGLQSEGWAPELSASCQWCHSCLENFALPFPGSCFLLQILVGGIWITTHDFDGNLLWFLFSLRLLNINSNCICFLKQLASMIVLPFVHQ